MAGRIGWKVIALVAVAFGAGCDDIGKTCTDIGCESGVSLSLAPRGANWEEGDYVLELELDGRTRSCAFNIGETTESDVNCGSALRVYLSQTSDQRVDEVQVSVTGAPKTLGVRLARAGTVVLTDSLDPDYETLQPNAGCEPICQRANIEIEAR